MGGLGRCVCVFFFGTGPGADDCRRGWLGLCCGIPQVMQRSPLPSIDAVGSCCNNLSPARLVLFMAVSLRLRLLGASQLSQQVAL
jgi:hypothetical protein